MYWSAVYPYSKGGRAVKRDTYYYKKNAEREGDHTQIKFKTPSSKDYNDLHTHLFKYLGKQKIVLEDYVLLWPYNRRAKIKSIIKVLEKERALKLLIRVSFKSFRQICGRVVH